MEWLEIFKGWFLSLGEKYHVNPYIFGGIYIGAIPFFFLCLSWTIRNIGSKKSFSIPVLLTGFFFSSAYVYLMIVGENIPVWVYVFIILLVIYGIYSTFKRVKKRIT